MLVLWQWTTGLWVFGSVLERWWDTSALWRGLNPQTPSAHASCPTSATAPVSWTPSSRAPPLCLFLLGPGPPFLSLYPLHLQPHLARFPKPTAGIWPPMPPSPCWATLHRPCVWDLWALGGQYWVQRWPRFVDCPLSPDSHTDFNSTHLMEPQSRHHPPHLPPTPPLPRFPSDPLPLWGLQSQVVGVWAAPESPDRLGAQRLGHSESEIWRLWQSKRKQTFLGHLDLFMTTFKRNY